MKQLPCIKKFVLGQCLKTIISMTNNLTDMIFDRLIEMQYMQFCVSKIEYVVRTHRYDVNTLL